MPRQLLPDMIGMGSTKADVVAELGKPDMQIQNNGRLVYYYAGREVEFKDGKVAAHEDDLFYQIDKRAEEKAFEDRQRAKGLVNYNGQWMTSDQAVALTVRKAEADRARNLNRAFSRARSPRPAGRASYGKSVSVISNGGKKVNLDHMKKKGKITIVDFYADWCGPCRKISPYLEEIANKNAEVHLVKINVVNWGTPVAKQFKLKSIPHVRVYNKRGKQIGSAYSGMTWSSRHSLEDDEETTDSSDGGHGFRSAEGHHPST